MFDTTNNQPNPNNDEELLFRPEDTISQLCFSPNNNNLLAGACWDNQVYLWTIGSVENKTMKHEAPVLTCCWSSDGRNIFSGGCDCKVLSWEIETNLLTPIAIHEKPVKVVKFIPSLNLILTGSWDKTLCLWDVRTKLIPAITLNAHQKIICADFNENNLIVGTSNGELNLVELKTFRATNTNNSKVEVPKLRSITSIGNNTFMVGSMSNMRRINIQNQKIRVGKTYHNEAGDYPIHDIAFHKEKEIVACSGGGFLTFYANSGRFENEQSKRLYLPVNCASYSFSGSNLVYGVGYDWTLGENGYDRTKMKNHVYLSKRNFQQDNDSRSEE